MTRNLSEAILFSLICLFVLAGCSDPKPISIGFVGGISGRVADLGQAGRNGALLAVEEFNQAGGLDGRAVELIVRDDAQDVPMAIAAINDLAKQGIRVVIGPMTSSMAVKMVPEAQKHDMVLVSPTVTTAQLTGKDDNFLRVLNSTDLYATYTAEYAVKRLGLRRYAVAYDTNNAAYTESWLEHFSNTLTELGGQVIEAVPFNAAKNPDYNRVVSKMVEKKPTAVLFIASAVDVARLANVLRQLAPEISSIAGAPWAATESLMQLGGEAVEGMIMPQFFNRYMNTASYLRFKEQYQERFQQQPGFASVAGYDAAIVVLEALKAHGEDADFKQVILQQKKFPGLQQVTLFDEYGDATRPVFMTRIEKGRYMVVE